MIDSKGCKVLTTKDFWTIIEPGNVPAAVLFWTKRIAHCTLMAGHFTRIASEFEGRITFGSLETDRTDGIAQQLGVETLPTVLLFLNGQPVEKLTGVFSVKHLANALNQMLEDWTTQSPT